MARVGFIVGEMVEDVELRMPLDRIGEAGHEVIIIGETRGKKLSGKRGKETFIADQGIDEVDAGDLDALVIPGGYSPDHLRTIDGMVQLVRDVFDAGKPVAAVCHGPWMLAEADIADQMRMTSWPSIKTDLINAGADWVDEEVVEDENLITSRNPDDLPAFCDAILRQLENQASERAQPEAMAEERDAGSTGEDRAWRGGEGEGRPETRDMGGLQQRELLRGGDGSDAATATDVEDGDTPGAVPFREERITGADVDEKRRQQQGAQPDRAPDASKELSPDDLDSYIEEPPTAR